MIPLADETRRRAPTTAAKLGAAVAAIVTAFLALGPVSPNGSVAAASPGLWKLGSAVPGARTALRADASAPSGVASGVITKRWGRLFLDGKPYRFLSLNAPNAATLWSVNQGCGAQPSEQDLDSLFSSLPPRTVVPFWATQAMAWNSKGGARIDFTAIDRVFAAAQRHNQFVMPELATQQGWCSDGHWKDEAWYAGGFRAPSNESGLEPNSYWDYLHMVVPRYRSSPALAMWTPVVEPEAANCAPGFHSGDCYQRKFCPPDAAGALRSFFDVVGEEVQRLDPVHLVNSGTLGGGQCGIEGSNYGFVHASPGVDVCDMHDYEGAANPITPGWIADIQACAALGKASILGETGVVGSTTGQGCQSLPVRASSFVDRFRAFFDAGASGVALWQWAAPSATCGLGVSTSDPVIATMTSYPR